MDQHISAIKDGAIQRRRLSAAQAARFSRSAALGLFRAAPAWEKTRPCLDAAIGRGQTFPTPKVDDVYSREPERVVAQHFARRRGTQIILARGGASIRRVTEFFGAASEEANER